MMKSRLFVWISLLALLTLFAAAEEPIYVYDGYDLLTEAAEYTYIDHARTVYDEHGLLCVVVTGENLSVTALTEALPTYAFDAVDMVLLGVDMAARHFDLYQYNAVDGEASFRLSLRETDEILDGILEDMKSGNYLSAFLCYIDLAVDAFENAENFSSVQSSVSLPESNVGDAYSYVEYPKGESFWAKLVKALASGAVAGGIATLGVRLAYRKKVHGETYPLSEFSKLELTAKQDNFINKTVVRTKIQTEDNNHGGSSGGFHGGGSFHGGGGGAHMGGRSF